MPSLSVSIFVETVCKESELKEVLCIGNNYVKFVWFVFIKLLIFIC